MDRSMMLLTAELPAGEAGEGTNEFFLLFFAAAAGFCLVTGFRALFRGKAMGLDPEKYEPRSVRRFLAARGALMLALGAVLLLAAISGSEAFPELTRCLPEKALLIPGVLLLLLDILVSRGLLVNRQM